MLMSKLTYKNTSSLQQFDTLFMESASNFWKWYPCGRTFLIKATEKVSQETMPWSMSSTKAVSVKESRSPKLKKTRQQPLATSLPLTCTESTAKTRLYRAIASEKNQELVQLKNRRTWSQSSWCSCPSEEQWMPERLAAGAAVELHWQKWSVVSCSSLFLGHYSYDGWAYN